MHSDASVPRAMTLSYSGVFSVTVLVSGTNSAQIVATMTRRFHRLSSMNM
jgi:hypothetical protein